MRIAGRSIAAMLALALSLSLVSACGAEEPFLDYPSEGTPGTERSPASGFIDADSTMTPSPVPFEGADTTVRTVFSTPVGGTKVCLAGRVVELLSPHGLMLDDGTGTIHVESASHLEDMRVGDTVVITGVVDVEESPFRVKVIEAEVEQ